MRWENDRELDYVPTQYCIPMTPLQLEEREKEIVTVKPGVSCTLVLALWKSSEISEILFFRASCCFLFEIGERDKTWLCISLSLDWAFILLSDKERESRGEDVGRKSSDRGHRHACEDANPSNGFCFSGLGSLWCLGLEIHCCPHKKGNIFLLRYTQSKIIFFELLNLFTGHRKITLVLVCREFITRLVWFSYLIQIN